MTTMRSGGVEVRDFSFRYPGSETKAVDGVSFSVAPGSFTVVVGPSGSGKTTLLRCLKPELSPYGDQEGVIDVKDCDRKSRRSHHDIAFVMQNPTNQIVMDVVWHELAFGLENSGLSSELIERRIAETAHFFGISNWIHRKVSELSGGEKQILNLASALIMHPRILILDEPTAQLDPVAIKHFLNMVQRIHREVGTTIIMSEHRIGDVFPMASDVLYLEEGKVSFFGAPREFATHLLERDDPFKRSLPEATRIIWNAHKALGKTNEVIKKPWALPLSVQEAREQLREIMTSSRRHVIESDAGDYLENAQEHGVVAERLSGGKPVLYAKRLWFRYKSDAPFVLEEMNCALHRGTIHALVGGNGSGKSTLLYLLAGVLRPQRGNVFRDPDIKVSLLTQSPQAVFARDTLFDDLMEHRTLGGYDEERVHSIADNLGIRHLLARHPYDLSEGEMQKGALAKILLLRPDVLLLDEPVKGLDASNKHEIGELLRRLRDEGMTVLIVTHDLEFSASIADECSLIFDGRIVAQDEPSSFFRDNAFYTTDIFRVTRGIVNPVITMSEWETMLEIDSEECRYDLE